MTLIVTDAGLAKAVQAEISGINLVIAEVAIGTNGYTPDSTITSLQNEIIRKVLTGGKKVASNQISLQVLIDDDGEIVGREIGFYLDDGTLFAVDSDPDNIITYKSATQGSLALETFDLVLDSIPPNTITVSVIGNMIEHEAKSNPHPQYVFGSRTISTTSPLNGGGALSDDLTLTIDSTVLVPVGVPLPWGTDTAPDGYAIMKGQSFDVDVYTELALIFTNGVIDDMRGLAIVGKNDDETVLSYEADGVIAHNHTGTVNSTNLGTKTTTSDSHYHKVYLYNDDSSGTKYVDGTSKGSLGGTANTSTDTHSHTVTLGSHNHTVAIASNGNTENTIKNRKFNWIVRMA